MHSPQNFSTWKPEIDMYMDEQQDILKDVKPLYETIFTVTTSDRLQLTDVGYTGFSPMVEVSDSGDAIEDESLETYTSLYQRKSYRKEAKFTSDLMETDQTGKVEDMAKGLVKVVPYTRNLNFFGMIRNMANPQYKWGDSKTLLSTLHPRKDGGGTQSNTFADGAQRPLSPDNVLLLEDQMYSIVSNIGNLLQVGNEPRKKVIWCTYKNREVAFQIAGTKGPDGKPYTDNNDRNYFIQGANFDVLVLDFVNFEAAKQAGETGTITKNSASNYWDTMWGILDAELCKKLFKGYIATGYSKFAEEENVKNQVLSKYAYDKYMFGNSGWFGFFGSKGDGSTLSI